MTESQRAKLHGEILAWGSLAVTFAIFAWCSWRTWPDFLIDFGHELYIPWRMCMGDVLYRDIAFTMGPLSQYLNTLLFRLFGISLSTLIWANLVLLAAILAMLLWLFRRCGTQASATFVGLFFLAVFAFAQYRLIGNYNYICPYRHETTHGLALGLANLICLVRWGETRKTRWLIASGLCLGLVALAKVEMFLPAAMTFLVSMPLILGSTLPTKPGGEGGNPPRAGGSILPVARSMLKWTAVSSFAAAVPVALAWYVLASRLGWRGAWDGILFNYRLAIKTLLAVHSQFYTALSGFAQPTTNVADCLLAAAAVLAAVIAAVALNCFAESFFSRLSRSKMWTVGVGIIAALGGLIFVVQSEWSSIPAALPALLPLVVVVSFRRAMRRSDNPGPAYPLCLLAVYSIGLLPKILLKADWGHYGFVLAMPGTLVLVHLAVHSFPRWMESRVGSGNIFQALAVGLLSACALLHASIWIRIDRTKTLAIGSGGDRFYTDPKFDDRSLATSRTLEYLQRVMRADETLVVLPEGTTLNYLLRKRNPTPYLIVNPFEFDAFGGEEPVLETLVRSAPDYIVFVTMNMAVHGLGEFGNPLFGARIRAFIEDQYEIVDGQMARTAVNAPPTFRSTVFRRRKSRT